MLESTPTTRPPAPPGPPVPPVLNAAAAAPLSATLGRARNRIRWIRIQTAGLYTAGAFLALWTLAVAFAADHPWIRILALAIPALALVGFALAGPLWLWRFSRTDEEMARLLGHEPSLRSALVSAVQLESQLGKGAANFSPELARAHIAETARRAAAVDLEKAFPAKTVRWAGVAAVAGIAVAMVISLAAPRKVLAGIASLMGSSPSAPEVAEKLAEPITYDIELTYVYPAYTGLQSKTVPGTTGEISAPAGTEVQLKTRADRDVEKAAIAVGDQVRELTVSGKRDLTGKLIVSKPGSYKFRFLDKRGKTVAEGPPIPIAVEADAPPKVSIYAPAPEIEVDPRGDVTVRYDAQDDYGLQSVELVYKIGGAPEQRISLAHEPGQPKHTSGDYKWSMSPLGLSAGDRVSYRIEARDTDTVNGPKLGKTREQVLKVYSEAEHHRMALQRVEKLWEQMISQLAANLDAPDRTPPDTFNRNGQSGASAFLTAATNKTVDDQAATLVSALLDAAADLRKDRSAPKEIPRALGNIGQTLQATTHSIEDARSALERWSRPGVPDLAAVRRLKGAAEGQIAELEKDTIYLEKLLDHRRIEDLQALAKDLAAKRRDLANLIEQYQKAPDDKTKAAITQEIARLKERIGELMQRMAELSRSISDEHMNADALEQMSKNESMLGALDKVQKLLNEGKIDEAMKELQKLGDQMDQLQQGLQKAKGGFDQRQDPELAKQFQQFNQQLQDVAKQQRDVASEARNLKKQGQQDAKKQLEQKGADFADKLRQKVAAAKQKLQAAANTPGSESQGEQAEKAMESADQLDHALQGKDYDAAAEEAARALALAQELEGDLKYEANRSRRFPGLSFGQPDQLDKAAEQAKQGVQPLADVKKELDQLFPKGSAQMTPEQRQKLSQLQKKQSQLQQQSQQLQQQMDQLGKKAPIFSQKMKGQMQQAGEQMQGAENSMAERDPNGSASHAGDAATKLEQLQQGIQQAMKGQGGGGGGMMLPMPGGEGEEDQEQQDGDGQMAEHEQVEIPNQDQPGSDAYRKDIMDAMKQGAPAKYKDQVKKYYEEIVK